jgi:hypothetical protein
MRIIVMSDIPIFNETDYDLTPFILKRIKDDVLEYFGESIQGIRVQIGIERNAYNTKTREVRYAFFPSDYGLTAAPLEADEASDATISVLYNEKEALLPSDYDDDADEDETTFAGLDDDLDVFDDDDDTRFQRIDPDFESIDTSEDESFYEDDEDFAKQ